MTNVTINVFNIFQFKTTCSFKLLARDLSFSMVAYKASTLDRGELMVVAEQRRLKNTRSSRPAAVLDKYLKDQRDQKARMVVTRRNKNLHFLLLTLSWPTHRNSQHLIL